MPQLNESNHPKSRKRMAKLERKALDRIDFLWAFEFIDDREYAREVRTVRLKYKA